MTDDAGEATAPTSLRVIEFVVAATVLGVGVSLVLGADLGADGFAMLIDGLSLATGIEFVVANVAVSVLFVAFAWWRGRPPGIATVALPVVVGSVVSLLDDVTPEPSSLGGQVAQFALAFATICVGVAGYLASDLGAGPTEAAALAVDPPVPFRWSYNLVQLLSGAIGWALGATLGFGTLVVVVLIGPCVDRLIPLLTIPRRGVQSVDRGR